MVRSELRRSVAHVTYDLRLTPSSRWQVHPERAVERRSCAARALRDVRQSATSQAAEPGQHWRMSLQVQIR